MVQRKSVRPNRFGAMGPASLYAMVITAAFFAVAYTLFAHPDGFSGLGITFVSSLMLGYCHLTIGILNIGVVIRWRYAADRSLSRREKINLGLCLLELAVVVLVLSYYFTFYIHLWD